MEQLKRVASLYFFTTYGKIYANNSTKYFTYQYDEYSFDTTAYFIYKRLQKEKLLEIRNNSAWIALTDEGRKAALQGYVRYKSGLYRKKGRIKSFFTQFNLGASVLKNIIWITWLVMFLLMLLDIIQKDSTIIKVLKFLK